MRARKQTRKACCSRLACLSSQCTHRGQLRAPATCNFEIREVHMPGTEGGDTRKSTNL